jgi:dTDP-4-amino-4,6-dideoxygalactose transaminase
MQGGLPVEALSWDTDFFGFPVGRITINDADVAKLAQEAIARSESFRLLYCFADTAGLARGEVSEALPSALWVDGKQTYVKRIAQRELPNPAEHGIYPADAYSEALYTLALQSGEYSRFRTDPNLDRRHFERLYGAWMEASVSRTIAQEVFVHHDAAGNPDGVITLGEKSGRMDIGLVAVDTAARGKGIAGKLLEAAEWYALAHGFTEMQVVTQEANTPACRLYEKAGYQLEKSINIFHIWNNQGPKMIPFNKPFLTGKETTYIQEAVASGKISGDGVFTKKCHRFFEERFGFKKVLLTTSCTDALEMAAILIDIRPGDEVIMPAYTFVSTANAFVLRGARIVFADSYDWHPNIDADKIEGLITPKTKAIVPVHYAGMACDMDKIMAIASKYNLFVIEDAAQAIDSYHKSADGSVRPLGSIGHLAAFSFHETKNIISGEGGMLVINDDRYLQRAEIIREKGTNRSSFFRGEVDKYGWVDLGSSYLPSDIIAAFLYAQLENLDKIQEKRRRIWQQYYEELAPFAASHRIQLPVTPQYGTNNAHMFYLICDSLADRDRLIAGCKEQGINPVFHYLSLHKSPYYMPRYSGGELPFTDLYSDTLVRLPFYYELDEADISSVTRAIKSAFA